MDPGIDMECPNCKRSLGEGATYCAYCGWRVGGGTLDRATTNLVSVGKEAARAGLQVLERAGRAIEPVVEKGVKTVSQATRPVVEKAKPHVEKASKTIERAVEKGARATKKVAHKSAEVAERAARKMKEKTR